MLRVKRAMECEVVKSGVVGKSQCGDAKSDNGGQKEPRAGGSKSQTSKSRVSGSVGQIHEELRVAEGGQVANPKGFQAWMCFVANDKPRSSGKKSGVPETILMGQKGVGSVAATEEANVQWGEGVTWSMIEAEMESMRSLEIGEVNTGEEIREIRLDIGKVAEKIGRFRRTATVLQAIESAPSRDRVVEWIGDVIVRRRGAQISQVKALSRREFLIVFESEAEKKLILEKPPCFLDGRVVRLVEWCSRKQERYADHLKAVWVELRDVPPFLEDQVSLMLEALGPIVYQALDKTVEMRYANVRGCVMLDMSLELPPAVGIKTPWLKTYLQPVVYTRLPDRCYQCLQQGHMARNCPGKKEGGLNRPPEGGCGVGMNPPIVVPPVVQGGVDGSKSGETSGADFLPVKSKSKSKISGRSRGKETVSTSSSNRFNLLSGDHGEDPEVQKGEDSWVQDTPPVVQVKASSHEGKSQCRDLSSTAHISYTAVVEGSARDEDKSGADSLKVSRLDKETAQLLRGSMEPAKVTTVSSPEWIVVQERERLAEALARSYQDLQNEEVRRRKETNSTKKHDTSEEEEVAGEIVLMEEDCRAEGAVTPLNLCSTAFRRILGERDENRSSKSHACENNPFRSHFTVLQESDVQLEIGKAVSFDGVHRGKGPRKKGLDAQKDDWKPIDDGKLEVDGSRDRKARDDGLSQVEMADDARGKSVVLSGREERVWKDLSLEKGLVDCLFCAAESTDSRFTRMAKKGDRFDFSRLDRVYLTNGASWADHVRRIVNHGTSALSDHQPVSTSIQILPEEGRRRNESYFKMDVFELKRQEVLTKVEAAWKDESVYVRDDRRRWARSWHRVRNLLKQVRNEGEAKRKEDSKLAEEVKWRREQVNEESSVPELDMLKTLETRLKEYEINEARVWRLRSREKWLSLDDAPYRYFFAKLRAKWSRESLEALEDEEGAVITDKMEILAEIHTFYQLLYTCETDSLERAETREAVVRLIQPKLPVEVSLRMVEVPDRLEIELLSLT
ncbi:hypothetical protein R1sor_022799 [Riccia sorocarpa]|uniref:CCHC-type domain-containing protein n=1 Tax=Riccia sorocarpa TaxID=122646 RepID=A0ABD3GKW9_9MARC